MLLYWRQEKILTLKYLRQCDARKSNQSLLKKINF